jgi:hypothetical protein
MQARNRQRDNAQKREQNQTLPEQETISKAAELLLASSIPHVENQAPSVCVELKRVHFHAHSSDILLLEFTLQEGMSTQQVTPEKNQGKLKLQGDDSAAGGLPQASYSTGVI